MPLKSCWITVPSILFSSSNEILREIWRCVVPFSAEVNSIVRNRIIRVARPACFGLKRFVLHRLLSSPPTLVSFSFSCVFSRNFASWHVTRRRPEEGKKEQKGNLEALPYEVANSWISRSSRASVYLLSIHRESMSRRRNFFFYFLLAVGQVGIFISARESVKLYVSCVAFWRCTLCRSDFYKLCIFLRIFIFLYVLKKQNLQLYLWIM